MTIPIYGSGLDEPLAMTDEEMERQREARNEKIRQWRAKPESERQEILRSAAIGADRDVKVAGTIFAIATIIVIIAIIYFVSIAPDGARFGLGV